MNKHLFALLLLGPLLATSGCASLNLADAAKAGTPASNSPPPSSSTAETSLSSLEESCRLLNTHDLAGFFPTHTETILPKPQINQVNHPAFFEAQAPGMETSCVYYTFHLPGSHTETVLQVNYWLDWPDSPSVAQAWSQGWAEAGASASQGAQAIADSAFYKESRLSFKEGDVYMIVEAVETDWNLNSSAGRARQLAVEEQLAGDMLSHLR